MAANNLAVTASALPSTPTSVSHSVSSSAGNSASNSATHSASNAMTSSTNSATNKAAAVKGASSTDVATAENNGDDFGAMLTQLLSATDTPVAPVVTLQTTDAAAEESSSDDAILNTNADAATLMGAGIPWELLLANTSKQREPDLSALSSGIAAVPIEGEIGAALQATPSSALQARASMDGQSAQVARELQALLGQASFGKSTATSSEQSLAQDRNANAEIGATNAAVSALGTQLDASLEASNEQTYVRAHVGAAAWADELGLKLTWLTERGIQSASLRLSPEHLGPLEIRITVTDDQASVWFGAAHADTRIALEQALPRLRELFASQGLNLADAGVFREPPREQAKNYQTANNSHDGRTEELRVATLRARGIVDAYA